MSNSIKNIRPSDTIKGSIDRNEVSATNKARSRNPIDADYPELDDHE